MNMTAAELIATVYVDRLAAEGSPDLATAQDLEACAFENLRAHIVTNSLPRATVEIENPSKPPHPPAS